MPRPEPEPALPAAAVRAGCAISAEQRLSGQAMRAWLASQRTAVPGFAAHSVMIEEPGGRALVTDVAADIACTFALAPGQALAAEPAGARTLAAELRAACDLVALTGRAVPFETDVAKGGALPLIVRGVALPLEGGPGAPMRVQAVLSWRQLLGRSARQRLRRELGAALEQSARASATAEPFPAEMRRRGEAAAGMAAGMLPGKHMERMR